MFRSVSIAALTLVSLAGCTVGPDHATPESKAPEAWPAELEGGLTAEAADLRTWWRTFNDPTLDGLVDRALVGSLDLREAAARVREARALRGVTASELYPEVGAAGSASRNRESENTFGGFGGGPGQESDFYEIGFDATWEIDLFGRVRRSVEAADAEIDAAVESARDARVVLLSEVARTYLELREAQTRLAIARQNLGTQEDTLGLSRDRLDAGLGTELQVAQAVSQLESTRSQIPLLVAAERRAMFRLDVLLGLHPGTLRQELETAGRVPPTPGAVPVGLPAELLRRRPDIRRAERELAAATARIGAATAELYPSFRLNGTFGLASEDSDNLFDGDSHTWGLGPIEVRWPIFTGGRVRSNIRVQEARQEQALVRYERTVLQAHEEVANALVAYARELERRESLAAAVRAGEDAFNLANDLWTRGLTDFLNVLDTQRELFQLQDQLASSDARVSTGLVAVYKALGGGWEEETAVAASSGDDASNEQ